MFGPLRVKPALVAINKPVIGMQRLADQLLGNIGAIGIGGVDEIDAQFRQPLQHPQRLGLVARRTPDAGTGDLHGAKAQPVDRDLAADLEGARTCTNSVLMN